MAWVAVDKNGDEAIYEEKPLRGKEDWLLPYDYGYYGLSALPKGSIKKLIGRELTWENDPVEIGD